MKEGKESELNLDSWPGAVHAGKSCSAESSWGVTHPVSWPTPVNQRYISSMGFGIPPQDTITPVRW